MSEEAIEITIVVFALVYLAMALGKLPGLRIDRTGAAIVGAIAIVATEVLSGSAAWNAIDYSTIGLLFGLMIVSSAFIVSGFYDWAAGRVGSLRLGPNALLAVSPFRRRCRRC